MARKADWAPNEKWQSQVYVSEQLTQQDYENCHWLHAKAPCRYAVSEVFCTSCAAFYKAADRCSTASRTGAAFQRGEGGKPPPQQIASVVNWRGRENDMWKGRVVNVLAGMRPPHRNGNCPGTASHHICIKITHWRDAEHTFQHARYF